jgi:hypothetical protein
MSMFATPFTRRFEAYWAHESSTPFVDRLLPSLEKDVTTFVTRHGRNGKEGTGRYRLNGTLQGLDIAN